MEVLEFYKEYSRKHLISFEVLLTEGIFLLILIWLELSVNEDWENLEEQMGILRWIFLFSLFCCIIFPFIGKSIRRKSNLDRLKTISPAMETAWKEGERYYTWENFVFDEVALLVISLKGVFLFPYNEIHAVYIEERLFSVSFLRQYRLVIVTKKKKYRIPLYRVEGRDIYYNKHDFHDLASYMDSKVLDFE